MSSGLALELSQWGFDDSVRLVFWDSMAGHDVVLILNADGTCDRADEDPNDDDAEIFVRVNLVEELRGLYLKWDAAH